MYKISFYLNGKFKNALVKPSTTILNFLRNDCGLTGTKEGCSEGDCGACIIVIGENQNGRIRYKAVNSCLLPAVRMHGKHIITIESLGRPEKLHPIQKAILDYHGVQCGYCTPGIIMSLFGLFINNPTPSKQAIKDALEGNLCRCTGYESIIQAALSLSQINRRKKVKIIPDYFKKVNKLLLNFDEKIITVEPVSDKQYLLPANRKELFDYLEHYRYAKIINGGTDLMVDVNIRNVEYDTVIDISLIKEFNFIKNNKKSVVIGANVNLSGILNTTIIQKHLPLLCQAIIRLGSIQIRNIATLAGNIANASPIADVATALLALNAKLIIVSPTHHRKIYLSDFYYSYKKTDLKQNEIIHAIEIPLAPRLTNFEKTAKRQSVDIASVNSAISLKVENNIIKDIILAFGGVAPYPIIVKKTCQYLINKKIEVHTVKTAQRIALSELKPISDLRGSAEFRQILIRNHITKHFSKLFGIELN
jgi:xanthine dehydrogenase small subunit